ncbi:IclR family transcriptional regulator [Stutzerimonas nitrititolerans]|uniref:IclR family transcriptional regulator n=1 Tax=Stutzerimonas nitrititolerans TaxID=2482751 RepID=UPI0028AF30DC|nr:helix-turn-helix domain-containing protein [Stutzerimonas nitrititolerans]
MSKSDVEVGEDRAGGIQVISRAASILNLLGAQPGGMSLGEIAQAVALPRSTVQRIVAALENEGMVRSEGAGGIGLGAGLLRLITSAHADLATIARPWLQNLSDSTEETVVLSRPSKLQLIVEHRVVADRELQVVPRLGLLNVPLHGSSAGRALLALENDQTVQALLSTDTSSTVKLKALLAQLSSIRSTGFACDGGELMEGITTSAVAINTVLGRIAISMPIPTVRFDKHRDRYLRELLRCKAGLVKEVGLNPTCSKQVDSARG